ncbi:MAG TPA: hypothetical protein VH208_05190 [Myxococcaceae bacterium]|nr:hypothetical protein [Myxococcaceae bacterium]
MLQFTQATPLAPQPELLALVQVALAQHWYCWQPAQAGVWHAPAWQTLPPAHAAQAAPPAPHWALVSFPSNTQVALAQQPVQLAALQSAVQAPFWQLSPPGQAAHAAPLRPQLPAVWLPTATQVVPLQHPVQLAALHCVPLSDGLTQAPAWQVCVPEQGAQAAPAWPH